MGHCYVHFAFLFTLKFVISAFRLFFSSNILLRELLGKPPENSRNARSVVIKP